MKRLAILASILLILGFTAAAQTNKTNNNACSGANELTAAEIDGILDAHNKVRADVGLPEIRWNCNLAKVAQEWATRGVVEHRPDSFYGENLFVASERDVSPLEGVSRWLAEKSFWDNSAGTCEAGKVCAHYTQLVSRMTRAVGCGINRDASGKWKVLMVCNYDSGNSFGRAY